MPIGNLKTWSFGNPGLVSLVLNDSDYQKRGYIWGFDGAVNYCFLDPERYALDIWQKEFWLRKLFWLLINIAAAVVLLSTTGPAAAIAALIAIPTLPYALLYHYRRTAEAQPAAVETNGPQMDYPGSMSTKQMVKAALAGGVAGVVAGMVAGFNAAAAAAAAAPVVAGAASVTWWTVKLTLPVVGLPVSGGMLVVLTAIGTGINAFALTLFIAGQYARPYDLVHSPKINDPGVGGLGTYHIGRNGQSISTYRVGKDPGTGLNWVCGGMTAIIINGIPANRLPGPEAATYADLFLPPPSGGIPNDFVIWGLIALQSPTEPFRPVDPPTGEDGPPPHHDGPTDPEQWAAGLIVVAGAAPWTHKYTLDLLMHHTMQAVATDGHLSPLLGSDGELRMETNMFLDPIQKYGIECLPE